MGIASDFVLIVIAGLVGALIARALRLPLLVGYVAAGVAVGPNTAVQPEFEGGVEMVRQALVRYPFDEEATQRAVANLRKELYGTAYLES